MSLIKSIIYYISVTVLVSYIAIMYFAPEKMSEYVGYRAFIVLSNSMEPIFDIDDMVVCKRVDEESLEVGDIITFSVYIPEINSNTYVTHYIGDIEETDDGKVYYTRGEVQLPGTYDIWKDESGNRTNVTFDDIEGEYLFKVPYLGYIKKTITEPIIFSLLIGNGTVLYILYRYLHRNDEDIDIEED